MQETKELIRNYMTKLKDKEILRICKEFMVNDYARRFKISQKRLFSALVGEDEAISLLSRLSYEQKVIRIFFYCFSYLMKRRQILRHLM